MTVHELIEQLKQMPPDLIVVWDYDDYEYHEPVRVRVITIGADMHPRNVNKPPSLHEGVPGRVSETEGLAVELMINSL